MYSNKSFLLSIPNSVQYWKQHENELFATMSLEQTNDILYVDHINLPHLLELVGVGYLLAQIGTNGDDLMSFDV